MIISTKCGGGINGCHVSGDSGGLEMPNASTAFMNLVGVDSEQCAGETRVVAGDAANSVLYQAISSASNCIGQRMPYQRAALTMQEIMTIRSWIDAGAMNN
jgi:hypothetical protein